MTATSLTDEHIGELRERFEHGCLLSSDADDLFTDSQFHRDELAKARAEIAGLRFSAEAKVERLREALEWYAEHALALASVKSKNADYAFSVVMELNLDGGKRARAVLAPPEKEKP